MVTPKPPNYAGFCSNDIFGIIHDIFKSASRLSLGVVLALEGVADGQVE